MTRRLALTLSLACCLLLFSPRYCPAASFKWPTAGPYVNEIAHLLFLGAMLFFIYEIYYAGLEKFRGFRSLAWALALLALWNLDAFMGRWAAWTSGGFLVLGEGWSSRLVVDNGYTWTVLLTQLANFILLVPAFYFFYRGLKALAQMPGTKHQ